MTCSLIDRPCRLTASICRLTASPAKQQSELIANKCNRRNIRCIRIISNFGKISASFIRINAPNGKGLIRKRMLRVRNARRAVREVWAARVARKDRRMLRGHNARKPVQVASLRNDPRGRAEDKEAGKVVKDSEGSTNADFLTNKSVDRAHVAATILI